jgi:hypothetical protein
MNRLHPGRKLAILATVASLAVGAAALGPASATAASCGSKTIAVSSKGGKTVTFPVSRIQVSGGATCKVAYKVIRGYVLHQTPSGWRVRQGTFEVPRGLTPEVATKGKMLVQFALVGGRE